MINLTNEQWKEVNGLVKSLATDYAKGFDEEVFGKGEIHKDLEGGYEQREYGGNYFTLESEIGEQIKFVLEKAMGDESDSIDYRMVEGFYELVMDFENWLTEQLPTGWYVYFEDGDIWVARRWDNLEDIDEDVKYLVNE
ncbi:hypothetical protein PQE75_gp003 [Bacillus phage vB_BcoS-136]|uniref:Uncharacterized protein n=1 Tax=Bacillus phage vB_BcoS-136 TaxID=2419619 RepID=A0A3G3BV80_9CAUD|nr:hypothetical protein PQE75_gp003 [Bacillus phage vB_BcoS-136]AYP68135.1 hypothetical protein vBBcoS136_00003 [Bacillus phage vB_BcoS-136]